MKLFGVDFSIKYITFEDDEHIYTVSYKKNIFGNITDVRFSKGDKGSNFLDVIDVEVKSTRPNLWGRFKCLVLLIKRKLYTHAD